MFCEQYMEPSEDDIKEVYARFGLACYMGEVLHRGLCHLYLGLRTPDQGMTGPRIDELMREAYAETLGGILNKVRNALSEDLESRLDAALEKRNYLAHHFWFDQVHMLSLAEGARALVEQLAETTAEFERINKELERLGRADLCRFGITDETFANMLVAASRDPMAPLPTQRQLKKEELIIAVYDAPMPGGGATLIFETDDHAMWQLCDVGLGWSRFEQVGDGWREAEPFRDLLPARIRPRPESAAPWEYDIAFGPRAALIVRLAPDSRNFTYRIRRKDRSRGDQPKP
jgi:hypothetical protein